MPIKFDLLSIPLLIGSIFGVLIGGYTNDVKLGGLAAAFLSTFIIYFDLHSLRWREWQLKNFKKLSIIFLICTILVCINFNNINSYIEPIDFRILPICCFGLGFLLPNFLINRNLRTLKIDFKLSLAIIIFYGFAVGHTFAGYYLKEVATYSLMFIGGLVTAFNNDSIKSKVPPKYKTIFLRLLYLFAIFTCLISFLAVFRKDFLDWASSSAFHWFYFVGPVSEYQGGGGIETFNQYSQGALLLASVFSKSPWNAVFNFQIFVYLLTILGIFLTGIREKISGKIFIGAIIFLLMFSDPWSVGPQAYPSSGLLRFFPLIAWASYIFADSKKFEEVFRNKNIKNIIQKFTLLIAIACSFLWSAEMAISITAGTIVVFLHKYFFKTLKRIYFLKQDYFSLIFRYRKLKTIIILSFLGLIILFILLESFDISGLNYIGQLIAYPFSYLNKGYGWFQPQAWVTLSPLFLLLSICSLALFSDMSILKKVGFLSCCGLVFGYVAYRPVSNNITASLPSSLILISSFFAGEYNLKTNKSKEQILNFSEIVNYLKTIVITLAFSSALLQLTHFDNVQRIIQISTGKIRGDLYSDNGGMKVIEKVNCKQGDKLLEGFIKDKYLLNNLRKGKTGLTYIGSKYNYVYELGNCYEYQQKNYNPFIFQPVQLYDAPIDKDKSAIAVARALHKRKFQEILFFSHTSEEKAERLRNYFFDLLPQNLQLQKTFKINDEFTGYLWKERE